MCLAVGAELLDEDEGEGENGEDVVDVELTELEKHDEGQAVLSDPSPKVADIQGE